MRRLPQTVRRALQAALVLPALAGAAAADGAAEAAPFDLELQAGVAGGALTGQAHKGLGADYGDLWERGESFWLLARGSVPIATGDGVELRIGLSLQFDSTIYPDGDPWLHPNGAVIDLGAMYAYRLLGGIDVPVRFGAPDAPVRFRIGPRLLAGYAYTPSVYASVWSSPEPFEMRFYRGTDSIAFDVTLRAAVTVQLGRRWRAGVVLFAGLRSHGAPEGSNTAFGPTLPAEMNAIQYGIAVVVNFRSALAGDAQAALAADAAAD